jgi:hypothetical protein
VSENPDKFCLPSKEEQARLVRYLDAAISDPVRNSILLTHGLIEELIEEFIKELVPNHESLNLDKMGFAEMLRWARALDCLGGEKWFWNFVKTFSELRNAAAHRNWDEKRAGCFAKLRQITALSEEEGFRIRTPDDDQQFLRSIMFSSFGYLSTARGQHRRRRTEPETNPSTAARELGVSPVSGSS